MRELEKRLSEGTGVLTEDFGWAAINSVLRENQVQARMELLTPMRHALTGRRVSYFRTGRVGAWAMS